MLDGGAEERSEQSSRPSHRTINQKIDYRAVSDLRPRENNPRTHTKKQIEKIAKSIQRFGFLNPILVDDDGYVVAGHGRLEAAKRVGVTEAPIIHLKGMSPADRRAYVIADNQLATLSGWNKDLLALEFAYLSEVEGFDPTLTGFELPEIDAHLYALQPQDANVGKDDTIPDLADLLSPGLVRPGLLGVTDCGAQMQPLPRHILSCSAQHRPQWFLVTRRIMSKSRGMYPVWEKRSIASLRWLPAR